MVVGAVQRARRGLLHSIGWQYVVYAFTPLARHRRWAQRAVKVAWAPPLFVALVGALLRSRLLLLVDLFVVTVGLVTVQWMAGVRLMKARVAPEIAAETDVIEEPDPTDDCRWVVVTFQPEGERTDYTVEARWAGHVYSPFQPPWLPSMTAQRSIGPGETGHVRVLRARETSEQFVRELVPAVVAGTPEGHRKTTRDAETLEVTFRRTAPPGSLVVYVFVSDDRSYSTEGPATVRETT